MDSGNHIVIELDKEAAPITVSNFQNLVSESFFDGIIFHRIIPGFMIQGGDPTGTGRGGSKTEIKGEFASNGVDNRLSHVRGAVSMARTQIPDSASSQFFICHGDSLFLDGEYAAFGRVIDGMDEVDRIAGLKTNRSDFPDTPPVMDQVFFVALTEI
ncbi:MAG TPA: peptidylprolyl isomerase [Clostridiaceae bacterium]|nr:peptidylprolyl isomerase [Clostridiaceae bacterium]